MIRFVFALAALLLPGLALANSTPTTGGLVGLPLSAPCIASDAHGIPTNCTLARPTFDPGNNLCITVNGVTYPPTATSCPAPTVPTGTGSSGAVVGGNGVPSPTVVMNSGNQQVYTSWQPVTASPAINRYSLLCGGSAGGEGASPVYSGLALTFTLTGLSAGTPEYCWVTASNLSGTSASSAEAHATTLTLPNSGTMPTLYPGMLAESGGANAATNVPAMPSGFYVADYSDTYPVVGFNAFDAWSGLSNVPASLHTGQASESDFINSVDGQMATSQGNPRIVNVPLVWQNTSTGCTTPGANLAAAAAGTYNSDYTTVANKLLTDFTNGTSGPRASVIVVRTGWEFNSNNAASCPWYSGAGNQSNFIGGYQQFVTQFRAAAAAFTPPAGVTAPTFKFVWCWLLDGDAPTASYPGDSYVDMVGPDVYVQPGSSYDSTDADTQFANMLTTANGLNFTATFATAHSKLIAFPEVGNGGETTNGSNGDNFGQWWKLFFTWISTHNVDHATIWNSDGGGYPGLCADGSRAQTCYMLRHMINPASFPVESLPWPSGISAAGGNGQIIITANPAPSSAGATNYGAFCGSASGGENKTTPIATASTPTFTITVPNGTAEYCMVAMVNAAGNWGFLSPEASATAMAPPANTPAHYVTMGSSGLISAALTSAITPTTNPCWETTFSPANSDMTGTHPLMSIYGPSGYVQSYYFGLSGGQPYLILKNDANSRPSWTASGATFTVGGWFTLRGCYITSTGSVQFYWGQAGVADGSLTALGPVAGTANFVPSTASYDPGLGLNPEVALGSMAGTGGDHFAGSISAAYQTNNGTTVASPIVGVSGVTDATSGGPSWSYTGTLH